MSKTRQPHPRSIQSILGEDTDSSRQANLLEENRANSRLLEHVVHCLPFISQSHCLNAQLSGKKLVIHADSPAWAAKLRYQLPAILPALRQQPGLEALREVAVRTTPGLHYAPSRLYDLQMTEQTASVIRELASAIRDEGLRKRWLKLAENAKNGNSSTD